MAQRVQLDKNPGFAADLLQFVLQSRKWWLVPIAVVLVLFGAILVLGGTSASPFIYSLF
jgi:hypothetical protein